MNVSTKDSIKFKELELILYESKDTCHFYGRYKQLYCTLNTLRLDEFKEKFMPKIEPKISINKSYVAAVKQFTDRTGFIEAFWNSIDSIQYDDTKVLVYYGVGGIGKTSLRKKLQWQIDNKDRSIIWTSIDFEIRQHRDVDNALIFLRTELSKKYKIHFNLFDFAYAFYLKKTSPQISLNEKSLPFIEEGSLVADIITTFKDIPLLGIPTKVAALLNKGHKIYSDWVTQKRIDDIVDMSLKEPKELLEYLPAYFAEDLKNHIDAKNKKTVIFLDTYEALNLSNKNDKAFFEADEWIREVLIPNLPGVLFVILGRQNLKWQEINSAWSQCIEQHLIGKLADEDAKMFLESAGLIDNDIIDSIIKISEGHPYSLDLCVDTYEAIRKKRSPLKEDFNFNNNKIQIFERFIKYLQISERETLKVLSVPRFWDNKIFELLIRVFNTGYPTSALKEFCEFSFISERILINTWEIHSLMRKSLQEYQGEKQLTEIHKIMFDYYSGKLKKTADKAEEIYLNEGYYHGKNCLDKEVFAVWFLDEASCFLRTGNILFLKDLLAELLEELKEENDKTRFSSLVSQLSYKLGKIYIALENYSKAEETLKYAETEGDKADRVNIISSLAILCKNTYNYKESENYFIKSISSYEELEREEHNKANSINKIKIEIEYGKLKVYLSENYEAMDIYNKVILEIDDFLKLNHEIYSLLSCKAVAFEKLGEVNSVLGNYQVSGELYKKAIEIYDQMIDEYDFRSETNSDLNYLLNNKGMAYKRLAEYYVNSNQFENARLSYRKALEIYDNSQEKFSENVDTYKKIGFAARGLLRLLINNNSSRGDVEQAFNKSMAGFNKAQELSPKDVSIINSIGGIYAILAKVYENEMNYEKALELYDIALEHSLRSIGIQPDYLYAYDRKSETLIYKAEIYSKKESKEKALILYEEALNSIQEILKRTPKALYALEKKETIERRICELKIVQ